MWVVGENVNKTYSAQMELRIRVNMGKWGQTGKKGTNRDKRGHTGTNGDKRG